ncbi:CHAT domain-containing protein [Frankia sp. R82]|uniref:CHAT domain-containing protein n=1 Tax=Frankia sp. R82 TaxID=2950553 RepID=UPI0020449A16|nr:CHAT domain-containing protein [Frankia sp. R82]MCM3883434.1 CHAT domain-containing protein [Frankia sp. R82]
MADSFKARTSIICENCGTHTSVWAWSVLDRNEHPAAFEQGNPFQFSCQKCGHAIAGGHVTVLLNAWESAPAITVLPILGYANPPFEVFEGRLEDAHRRVFSSGIKVRPPFVSVSSGLVSVAISRRLDLRLESDLADLADLPEEAIHAYRHFIEGVSRTSFIRSIVDALTELISITSLAEFERFLKTHPYITSPEALALEEDIFQGQPHPPEDDAIFIARRRLLQRCGSGAVADAWNEYATAAADFGQGLGARLESHLREVDSLRESHGESDLVASNLKAAAELAAALRLDQVEAHVRAELGNFLSQSDDPDCILEAFVNLERSATLLDKRGEPAKFARIQVSMGLAKFRYPRGDRQDNLRRARNAFEKALEYFSLDREPEIWCLCLMNLALVYLGYQEGDPDENAMKAQSLCEETLQFRRPERNELDWALSQFNLGVALARIKNTRASSRRATLARAIESYELSMQVFTREEYPNHWSSAHHNIADALHVLERMSHRKHKLQILQRYGIVEAGNVDEFPSEYLDEHLQWAELAIKNPAAFGESAPPWTEDFATAVPSSADMDLIQRAFDHVDQALTVRSAEDFPLDWGRTQVLAGDLCAVSSIGGHKTQVSEHYTLALTTLTVERAPVDCMQCGSKLGGFAAERGEWKLAAEAFDKAVVAQSVMLQEATLRSTREGVFEENPNLSRWAAYAIAKSGNAQRAVEVLEQSRARSLKNLLTLEHGRLGDLGRSSPYLASEFLRAREALNEVIASTTGNVSSDSLVEIRSHYDDVLEKIRSLPEFELFLKEPEFSDIARSALVDQVLAYVAPTPSGTVTLLVEAVDKTTDGDAEVSARAIFSPATSAEIVAMLLRADPEAPGILYGQLREQDVSPSIAESLRLLGERLVRPVAEDLIRVGHNSVTVVPCGPTGFLPIAAAKIGSSASLLDSVAVAFSPSGATTEVCRARVAAADSSNRRIFAVGNPSRDGMIELPGAGAEVLAIEATYGAARTLVLSDHAALKNRVLPELRTAAYIHFACHATTDIDDIRNSRLHLADSDLTLAEISSMGALPARLVTLSACQSAHFGLSGDIEEAEGLPTGFLAVGAASVIATLWQVDDRASALLMSRFYEELHRSEADGAVTNAPARALRSAQIWLRDLTLESEEGYLAARPRLRDSLPPISYEEDSSEPYPSNPSERPYSDPMDWAAFVAFGQ